MCRANPIPFPPLRSFLRVLRFVPDVGLEQRLYVAVQAFVLPAGLLLQPVEQRLLEPEGGLDSARILHLSFVAKIEKV